METHARYFLIGIFSLLVTAGLLLFVLWLGKLQLGKDFQEYDVRFHESVAGLAVGGSVQFHGIQIGEVRKLSLDANDPREISVLIRVSGYAPVKTDTKAQLSYTGLTGVAAIELFGGTPETKLLREVDSTTAPRIDSVPSNLSQLLDGSSGAVSGAQEAMARVAKLLSDTNIEQASKILEQIQQLAVSVNQDYPELSGALADARALEHRLSQAAERADSLIAQVQRGISANTGKPGGDLFTQARSAIKEVGDSASAIDRFATAGSGTLEGFDSGALQTEMLKLIRDLRTASANLERVTQRFDQAPIDYLLGAEALPEYTPTPQVKK
jgi:phospholipid/cholesterol/gamma-HCH transport system substrate-binding protein